MKKFLTTYKSGGNPEHKLEAFHNLVRGMRDAGFNVRFGTQPELYQIGKPYPKLNHQDFNFSHSAAEQFDTNSFPIVQIGIRGDYCMLWIHSLYGLQKVVYRDLPFFMWDEAIVDLSARNDFLLWCRSKAMERMIKQLRVIAESSSLTSEEQKKAEQFKTRFKLIYRNSRDHVPHELRNNFIAENLLEISDFAP
ncbi:MAG: hypothetical protein UT24_C0011G0001 [Candidatus Woesebacteria bacterium GW2011_GWB1_39_12]|uniref:Uncharacterized protein n=1 Tax=Candidatus Woesebacteria bacterium GW2011_GWB1_39_12 TaxID=1618574 RepID=A0A0G0MBF5_9BACT|nr:MAG: hypothetical protein UT24_C0011G0001 [Candidatus Woesebacteria bacterium GW2011_GWB1_39_12]